MKRRIVSILTCVVMAIAFMPAGAFAAQQYNYAAIGDASTAGYGMAATVGYPKLVSGTYPALIGDVISANGHTGKVSQLAMQKMRVEDFRAMIDDSYDGDSYTAANFPNFKQNRTNFKDSIKKANLITFNLGTVNIGSYFFHLAMNTENGFDSGYAEDATLKGLIDSDSAKIKKYIQDNLGGDITKIKELMHNAGYDEYVTKVDEFYQKLIKAVKYAYYSFCRNYEAAIEKVKTLNENKATIIVFGVDNMLKNLSLTVNYTAGEINVNLGKLYGDLLVDNTNNVLRNTDGVTFVETATDVERFLDEAKNYNGNMNSVTSQFKLYCDTLEDDFAGLKTDVTNYVKGKGYKGSNATNRINWGMKAVYHTAAIGLRNVAEITHENVDLSDIKRLLDNNIEISKMGGESMKKIREQCFTNGKLYADWMDSADWGPTRQESFINSIYCAPKPFGRIVMAVGVHSLMGNGFFVHPSAKGHTQLKNKVMNVIHSSSLHNYGGWVTKNADVGVAGSKTRTCSVCGKKEVVSIPAKNPAGTSLTKLTKGKKSFTVKWKKPSGANLSKITGYQLRYSLKSSMAGAKTVTITNKNTVSKKIKKLKSKKKYYVQVRTYRKTNKNYYSGWSAKKSVKTK